MAIHANSTPAPARPLLPGELAQFGLLPFAGLPMHLGLQHDRALLAILDAGPISPADLAFMSAWRRKQALLSIDALIDVLDAIEPDPDLEPSFGYLPHGAHGDECEPDGEEPNLGASEGPFGTVWPSHENWAGNNECEAVDEDGGDINDGPQDDDERDDDFSDREHSLGSLDSEIDQRAWSHSLNSDRELDLVDVEDCHAQMLGGAGV